MEKKVMERHIGIKLFAKKVLVMVLMVGILTPNFAFANNATGAQFGQNVTVKNATDFRKYDPAVSKNKEIHYRLGKGNTVKLISIDKYKWAKVENRVGTIGYCRAIDLNLNTVTTNSTQSTTNTSTNNLSNIYNVSIGSYITNIPKSTEGRLINVKLAAKRSNKIVLMPEESFVMSDHISDKNGQITLEDGYKRASVLANGLMMQGVGGGICQVATTIYLAALSANLEIKQGLGHSATVGYVKPGLDASYATGAKDLIIKNNKKYPVELNVNVINDKTLKAEFKSTNDVNNGVKYTPDSRHVKDRTYETFVICKDANGNTWTEPRRVWTYTR